MAKGQLGAALQAAVVAAMKQRQQERLGVLRMLQAQIKQVEVDQRVDLDDAGVVRTLVSYQRKVKEALGNARDAGRADLVAQARGELAVLAEFLPAELDDAALERIVREAIATTGAAGPQDLGKVMKAALASAAGRAEGGRISALAKRLLSG